MQQNNHSRWCNYYDFVNFVSGHEIVLHPAVNAFFNFCCRKANILDKTVSSIEFVKSYKNIFNPEMKICRVISLKTFLWDRSHNFSIWFSGCLEVALRFFFSWLSPSSRRPSGSTSGSASSASSRSDRIIKETFDLHITCRSPLINLTSPTKVTNSPAEI